MRHQVLKCTLAIVACLGCLDGEQPTYSHGVITYRAPSGRAAKIQVGTNVRDFWVAPGGEAVAFVRIERLRALGPGEVEPLVERSRIYIGLRSQGFRPFRVPSEPSINTKVWHVAQEPKLSPDLKSIYFLVPNYMTSLQLTRSSIHGAAYERIADVSEYCVVWGGSHSGDLIVLVAQHPLGVEPGKGITYPCFWRQPSGAQVELARECAASFEAIVGNWSAKHGGTCR